MGYNTDYEGFINITPAISFVDAKAINDFAAERHEDEDDVETPSIWCDFKIDAEGELVWNGHQKTYCGAEWIEYIINNFLLEYECNGTLRGQGEDVDDIFEIVVTNNKVQVYDLKQVRVQEEPKVEQDTTDFLMQFKFGRLKLNHTNRQYLCRDSVVEFLRGLGDQIQSEEVTHALSLAVVTLNSLGDKNE